MSEYTLPHQLTGEQQRLTLMSALLDPMERAHLERLGLRAGWRCLEVGCGNGSISRWLAERVAPDGEVVASDIDTTLLTELRGPCLDVRRIDILQDRIEAGAYDLVVARAVLHHLPNAHGALERMVGALKRGGWLLSIEPDMLPCTVTEPPPMQAFWQGWLQWSREAGIDYFIGRKVSVWLDSLGLADIAGEGRTAVFNGGSDWARYWNMAIHELTPKLLASGCVSRAMLEEFYARFDDAQYWTSVITFTANWGRKQQ